MCKFDGQLIFIKILIVVLINIDKLVYFCMTEFKVVIKLTQLPDEKIMQSVSLICYG